MDPPAGPTDPPTPGPAGPAPGPAEPPAPGPADPPAPGPGVGGSLGPGVGGGAGPKLYEDFDEWRILVPSALAPPSGGQQGLWRRKSATGAVDAQG
ncbi:hypothetical protein BU17DRAFT_49772 [Hysterangium stoloniferum]|nr:hypothetical protein BU17DRAFT_49772 [Hysterangium stoloniferum]